MAAKRTTSKPADTLKWIEKAAYIIRRDDNQPRYALTFAYAANGHIVAADGFRFHMVWDNDQTADAEFIALKHSEEPPKQRGKAETLTFPDYMKILPSAQAPVLRLTVDTDELKRAVKIAMLYAKDSANSVSLIFCPTFASANGTVMVAGRSAETGDAQTLVAATFDSVPDGWARCMAINGTFLLDALAGFSGTVTLHYFGGPVSAPHPFVVGSYFDRLACIMPMGREGGTSHTGGHVLSDTDLPPWVDMSQEYSAPLTDLPKAPKRKSVKPVKRSEAPEVVVTTTEGKLIHERVEYRRDAAAFADIQPRLTPENVAAMKYAEAKHAFENELNGALRQSQNRQQYARIAHRPEQRAILVSVRHDAIEKVAYVVDYRGVGLVLTEYSQLLNDPVRKRERAALPYYLEHVTPWQYVETLASEYGYTPEQAAAAV